MYFCFDEKRTRTTFSTKGNGKSTTGCGNGTILTTPTSTFGFGRNAEPEKNRYI